MIFKLRQQTVNYVRLMLITQFSVTCICYVKTPKMRDRDRDTDRTLAKAGLSRMRFLSTAALLVAC